MELNREVQDIFLHAQGKDVNTLSDQIVDVVNHKIMELSHEELKEEEKEQYKQEIIESLQGMLDYDVASSINEIFKNGDNIPPSVRFLISSSMSMTMDADKIDILNQRALGIYNTSYKVNSFDVFPPDQMSLREILNQYFHFHLDGDSFTLDNKALSVIRNMHSSVFEMIKKQIGNIPISTADRIVVYKDKVIADGVEYPSQELYTMFNDEWNSYVSRNMNFEHTDFKSFKKV